MNLNNILKDLSIEFPEEFKTYDEYKLRYFPGSIDRFNSILKILASNLLSGSKILDVGSGYGDICVASQKIGFEAYGIDHYMELPQSMISTYKITFNKCNIEADKFPFPDNYFDAVIFSEVLEHLNYSPLTPLKEIYRVLKINAICIITTPNVCNIFNAIRLLIGKNIFADLSYYLSIYPGQTFVNRHSREYNQKEIRYLLKKIGLKNEKIIFMVGKAGKHSNLIEKILRNILIFISKKINNYIFASNMLIICKKN